MSSQIDLHAQYGGVVPEVASRAHVEMHEPWEGRRHLEGAIAEVSDTVILGVMHPKKGEETQALHKMIAKRREDRPESASVVAARRSMSLARPQT